MPGGRTPVCVNQGARWKARPSVARARTRRSRASSTPLPRRRRRDLRGSADLRSRSRHVGSRRGAVAPRRPPRSASSTLPGSCRSGSGVGRPRERLRPRSSTRGTAVLAGLLPILRCLADLPASQVDRRAPTHLHNRIVVGDGLAAGGAITRLVAPGRRHDDGRVAQDQRRVKGFKALRVSASFKVVLARVRRRASIIGCRGTRPRFGDIPGGGWLHQLPQTAMTTAATRS